MTSVSPLMKSVLTHLAKNVLLPFRLSVGISAADAVIQKKIMDQVVLRTYLRVLQH